MIQFNLLPDVKKEYIKAKRTKRLIFSASLLVSVASVFIVVITYGYVQISQKGHINNLTDDIASELQDLRTTENLNEILTVQNQTGAVNDLHAAKPEFSRIFNYMTQLTPEDATITTLSIDALTGTMSVAGQAATIAAVNQFADTLKFTTYGVEGIEAEPIQPFSDVITRLNRDNASATYTIELTFDPIIFDNTVEVSLNVPDIVSTRSSLNKPGQQLPQSEDIFDDTPVDAEER